MAERPGTAGRPLVLVNDWIVDSSISDTGFAEAAADAFFAALVQLNIDQGGKVFNSPIHLIAFSRGTTVTGEIAQRLGTHFPQIGTATDLQMTTLDPHDIRQDSLNFHLSNALHLIGQAGELVGNVPYVGRLGKAIQVLAQTGETAASVLGIEQVRYDDFIDPKIQRWENITFHDNYYQEVARPSTQTLTGADLAASAISSFFGGGPLVTLTPNGRSIPQADIDLRLGSSTQGVQRIVGPWEPQPKPHDADLARTGFTHDVDFDVLGVGLAGLGGVHQRVKRWSAGTVNLALPGFERGADDSTYVELLFRILAHRHKSWNKHFDDVGLPWYTAHALSEGMPEPIVHGDPRRPWEGISASGDAAALDGSIEVLVDLSNVPAGTIATLYFDLLGFGAAGSTVVLDDVRLIGSSVEPLSLEFQLHPDFDSGVIGDDLTNVSPVSLTGITIPFQQVLLDLNGDGFADGSTLAGADGTFLFPAVNLVEGDNRIRTRVTRGDDTVVAERTIVLDTQEPLGSLAFPAASSVVSEDPGYVEIQWTDPGAAGLDIATFGIDNITITGVTVDRVTELGNGLVRYHYDDDGDTLPDSRIEVRLVAGAVADLAANTNHETVVTFVKEMPIVTSLSAEPNPVTRPGAILLTAEGVGGPEGQAVHVQFFRDGLYLPRASAIRTAT